MRFMPVVLISLFSTVGLAAGDKVPEVEKSTAKREPNQVSGTVKAIGTLNRSSNGVARYTDTETGVVCYVAFAGFDSGIAMNCFKPSGADKPR